jgi:SAM-dependent methyltransferase
VESDLASADNGISERFVPERNQRRLIDAERVSRYRWAAQVAKDRLVLDAGCGTGYGCRLLAMGGARGVIGVDVAGSVLEAALGGMPESVRLQPGDLRKLEFADDEFGLVVCFEVIEHVEEPLTVLDELVRVLAPGGLLLISSPNRGVHQTSSPNHRHEFAPAELEAELAARLDHVQLWRQDDYVVSAVLSGAGREQGEGEVLEDLTVHKLAADEAGREMYTLAIASDVPLPDMRQLAAMTSTIELHDCLAVFETQARAIADRDSSIDDLTARLDERARLAQLLGEAEQRLAQVPELDLRIGDLEVELAAARSTAEAARREADQLDRMLLYGRRMLRFVRPLIQPLRRLRRKLRG